MSYRRPANVNKTLVNTLRILSSALFVALAGFVVYLMINGGFQAVIDWFKGKWFALVAVVLVSAFFIAVWVVSLYKDMVKLKDE